jgi:GNAT superfamily N-acetyltransferase
MTVQARLSLLADAVLGRSHRAEARAVDVRLSRPAERDAILRLVAELGFNARDATTWDGLGMSAMTAWRGPRLVGAIPLEPRWWQLRPGCVIPTLHQTTVGVLPELQGQGIGSAMQEAIYQQQSASVATVFREDQTSRAYRWYRRNGFEPALRIVAWVAESPGATGVADTVDPLDPADARIDLAEIDRLWRAQQADYHGGFVCRTRRPLRGWLGVHPYRNRYRFGLLPLYDAGTLVAYAVLGVGQLHSRTTRVEIMEHATRDGSPELVDRLCRATRSFAARHGYRPVRWALASGAPEAEITRRSGFECDWQFDLLWRPLPACEVTLPGATERARVWRYHGLDYA